VNNELRRLWKWSWSILRRWRGVYDVPLRENHTHALTCPVAWWTVQVIDWWRSSCRSNSLCRPVPLSSTACNPLEANLWLSSILCVSSLSEEGKMPILRGILSFSSTQPDYEGSNQAETGLFPSPHDDITTQTPPSPPQILCPGVLLLIWGGETAEAWSWQFTST